MLLRRLFLLSRHFQHQWWPTDRLARLQQRRLVTLVKHAYENVPYYRRCLDSAGIRPCSITGLKDLHRIPITPKNNLAQLDPQEVIAANVPIHRLMCHRTGGSTGVPFSIYSSTLMEDIRVASLFATFLVNGYRPYQKIALLQAAPPKCSLLNRIGLFQRVDIPYHLKIEQQLNRLAQCQPAVLEGYPSRIGQVAQEILKKGIVGIRPELIITNSEVLTDDIRKVIQEAFGINPTNVYDAWEFGNIAWECPHHEGLHINSDRMIVEIVKEGKAVTGIAGEVVITDLYNEAMPFIRYATGDIAQLATGACTCGRTFPLINHLLGRQSERLILSDGSEVMATLPINALLKNVKGLREYQIIQRKIGELNIAVVADDDFSATEEKKIQTFLVKAFQLNRVEINKVAAIEKTPAFKHRVFISEIVS